MSGALQPGDAWRLERSVRSQLDVAVAVYLTREALQSLGLGAVATARVATVLSELATNAVHYAEHGLVLVSWAPATQRGTAAELVVAVRDNGPGIANVQEALREQHSTGGSLGLGLPAVQRMANQLLIETQPGGGTLVTARFWVELDRLPTER